MSEATAKALVKRETAKGHQASLYPSYSGRGMMGETTFAVVTSNRPANNYTRHRVDNLGKEYVIY